MFGLDVSQVLQTFGYAAVALLVFVEDFGIPAPGETVLIAAAVEAGQGNLNVFVVGLVALCAAVLGDNVGYAIGRYGGRPLVLGIGGRIHVGCHYLVTEDRFDHAQSFFDRYGAWMIVVARFIEGLRQLNGIIAGTMRYGWTSFSPPQRPGGRPLGRVLDGGRLLRGRLGGRCPRDVSLDHRWRGDSPGWGRSARPVPSSAEEARRGLTAG